jgi:hypothetical protein
MKHEVVYMKMQDSIGHINHEAKYSTGVKWLCIWRLKIDDVDNWMTETMDDVDILHVEIDYR